MTVTMNELYDRGLDADEIGEAVNEDRATIHAEIQRRFEKREQERKAEYLECKEERQQEINRDNANVNRDFGD